MSVQENGSRVKPCDLMASGLRGSGLSTEIKEPLLANYKNIPHSRMKLSLGRVWMEDVII